MSESGLKSANTTLVPESPAVKRQKTPGGYNSTGNSTGYNSGADSGDDLFQGIITTPAQKYQTQPTQIIDRTPATKQTRELIEVIDLTPNAKCSTGPTQIVDGAPTSRHFTQPTQIVDRSPFMSSPGNVTSPDVQIPESPPFRTQLAPSANNVSSAPTMGRLASVMAPAGTSFRAPYGATAPRQSKAPVIIDISDDDYPQYQGGSSDDDCPSRGEIKPSNFLPKSNRFSLTGSAANSSSPSGLGFSGPSRFNNIIANSKFDPNKATGGSLAESICHSKNRDPTFASSRMLLAAVKKGPDSMAMDCGSQKRPQPQSRPDRALPVPQDISLDDEQDLELRRKIIRIQKLHPGAYSVLMIRNAIIECNGNTDAAAELLMKGPAETSTNERGYNAKSQQIHLDPQMKRQIKLPVQSIHERYSSTQNPRKVAQPVAPIVAPPKKPRRRLQQGRRHQSSPAPSFELPQPDIDQQVKDQSDDDSDDSGIGSESEQDLELEGRVLAFINRCNVEDLADLANIKVDVAAKMIAQRPFKNLNAAREVHDGSMTKSGKKSNKAPIGEKIVQTAVDMWSGYEAVDALVAKCEQLGKPLANEISKWGFDVFGTAKTGELELVSFDYDTDSQRDSGIGTPSSKAASTNGEVGEDDVKAATQSRHNHQRNFLKQPAMMSSDITLKDYQLVGLNWLALLYKHKLSCILADDMGLGKTCQVIAFISHLAESGVTGPHLVIVPPSTLENWLREFQFFSPNLVVEPYYGSQAERADIADRVLNERDQINVVVSTYEFAAKPEDNKFMRRLKPEVCVYDEGHVLRNPKSQRYERLIKIPANFRLLLTGTPLQNNLLELAALLGFILPEIFRVRQEELDFIFKHKASTRDSDHAALLSSQRITRAKSMLTPFVLRRKKDQVLKHMPIKQCRVEYCALHPSQNVIYDGLREKAHERARLRLEGAKIPTDGENNPLMQLRKAAIHPMLFRRHFTDEKVHKMLSLLKKNEPTEFREENHKHLIKEMLGLSDWYLHIWCQLHPCIAKFDVPDLTWMDSGKVAVLVSLLEAYKANGDRVLIFSQFTLVLDILEAILETSRIQFTRIDGMTKVNERQTIIDDFRDDKTTTAFLLSTGAGGTGLNLMSANKVIIFDSSFNPQDDIQAENRAHRVGQTRDVEVVRLVTKGTIEEQIYALGQSKLALDSKVAGHDGMDSRGEELVAKLLLEEESKRVSDEDGTATKTEESSVNLGKPERKVANGGGGSHEKRPSRARRAKEVEIDDDAEKEVLT